MLSEVTAEERWKEARQQHIEKVALKRAKRKKKPVLSPIIAQTVQKRNGMQRREKKVDPRVFWYFPSLSSTFINFCQHGVSRKKMCEFCESDERDEVVVE